MHFKPTEGAPTRVASKVDFDRAKYECDLEVKQATKGRWAFGGLIFLAVAATSAAIADRQMFTDCMAARGYTKAEG
jgi:hypothetical protein